MKTMLQITLIIEDAEDGYVEAYARVDGHIHQSKSITKGGGELTNFRTEPQHSRIRANAATYALTALAMKIQKEGL